MISVTVIRHPKERPSKCSLEPLRGRQEMTFYKASKEFHFDATDFTLLAMDAPILTEADAKRPLLLLDSTWRLLPQLFACLEGEPIMRSLPPVLTAYPRISKISPDPLQGLASVEALYLAKKILGEDDKSLLDNYYWKEQFLKNLKLIVNVEAL